MVRETRHLWISNLPENIREEKIKEHFKRYGRVQNIKIFPPRDVDRGSLPTPLQISNCTCSAAISFMDIKSASKAHNMEHKIEDHSLSTVYFEPPTVSSSRPPPQVSPFPVPPVRYNSHGLEEDVTVNGFDRSSHYYANRDNNDSYIRRQPTRTFNRLDDSESMRRRPRERHYRRTAPNFTQNPDNSVTSRTIAKTPSKPLHGTVTGTGWKGYETPVTGNTNSNGRYQNGVPQNGPSSQKVAINSESYEEERREASPIIIQTNTKSSESGSDENSRASSRARSQSSSSVTSSTSSNLNTVFDSSDESSPMPSNKTEVNGFTQHAPKSISDSTRQYADNGNLSWLRVNNLHIRPNDGGNLKAKLKQEYQHFGRVRDVRVFESPKDRYAIVYFENPEDIENVNHDNKLQHGTRVNVDRDPEMEFSRVEKNGNINEFVANAARTIFINNLPKGTTNEHLVNLFKNFGEILDVDAKMNGMRGVGYCQFSDITGAVNAINSMDGKIWRGNKVTLGFSKSDATNCVWVKGIADSSTDRHLDALFNQSGCVKEMTIDRTRCEVLVFYEMIHESQQAVNQLRGLFINGRRLQADFASREFQRVFYSRLDKNVAVSVFYDHEHSSPNVRGMSTPSSTTSGNHVTTVPYCKNDTRLISKYFDSTPSPCSSTISTPRVRMATKVVPRTRVYRDRIIDRKETEQQQHSSSQLDAYCSSDEEQHTKSSVADSRPGTPLIDENPDIVPSRPSARMEVVSLNSRFVSNELDSLDSRSIDQESQCTESVEMNTMDSSTAQEKFLDKIRKGLKNLNSKYDNWHALYIRTSDSFDVYSRVKYKMEEFEFYNMNLSSLFTKVFKKTRVLEEDYTRTELNKKEVKRPEKVVLSYEMLKLENELRSLRGNKKDDWENEEEIWPVMRDINISIYPITSTTVLHHSINQMRKMEEEVKEEFKIKEENKNDTSHNNIRQIGKMDNNEETIVKKEIINENVTIVQIKEEPIIKEEEIRRKPNEEVKRKKPYEEIKEIDIMKKEKKEHKHEITIMKKEVIKPVVKVEKREINEVNGICKSSNEKHNRERSKEKKSGKDKKKKHSSHSQGKKKRSIKEQHYDEESDTTSEDSDYTMIHDNISQPVFSSMYDALKARTVKKLQKQEGNNQRDLKNIFNELKQSRAKRDIKRISTSTVEEDSDTDKMIRKHNNRMMMNDDRKNMSSSCDENEVKKNKEHINSNNKEKKHQEESIHKKHKSKKIDIKEDDENRKKMDKKHNKHEESEESNKRSSKKDENKENNESKKKSKHKESKKIHKHDDNRKHHNKDHVMKTNDEEIHEKKKKNKHHEEEGSEHRRKHVHKHHKSKKSSKTKKSDKYKEMVNGIEKKEDILHKSNKVEKSKLKGSMFSPTESMNEDYSTDDCLRVERRKQNKVKRRHKSVQSTSSSSDEEQQLVNGFHHPERNEKLVKNEICNKVFYNKDRHKEKKSNKVKEEEPISECFPSLPPKIDAAESSMDLYADASLSPPLLQPNSSPLSPLSPLSFDNSRSSSPFSPPLLETDVQNSNNESKCALSLPSLDTAPIEDTEVIEVSDKPLPVNLQKSGFDSLTDMQVQENAIKSISEGMAVSSHDIDEVTAPLEDKLQPGISLEETEDAIAAILGDNGEDDSCSFQECYTEQMTPSTETLEMETEEETEMGTCSPRGKAGNEKRDVCSPKEQKDFSNNKKSGKGDIFKQVAPKSELKKPKVELLGERVGSSFVSSKFTNQKVTDISTLTKKIETQDEKETTGKGDDKKSCNKMERQIAVKETMGKPGINATTLVKICQNGFNIKLMQGMWNTLSADAKSKIFMTIDSYDNKVRVEEDFLNFTIRNLLLKHVRFPCLIDDHDDDDDDDGDDRTKAVVPIISNPFHGTKGQFKKFIQDVCVNKRISDVVEGMKENALSIREITDEEQLTNEVIDTSKRTMNRRGSESGSGSERRFRGKRCRNRSMEENEHSGNNRNRNARYSPRGQRYNYSRYSPRANDGNNSENRYANFDNNNYNNRFPPPEYYPRFPPYLEQGMQYRTMPPPPMHHNFNGPYQNYPHANYFDNPQNMPPNYYGPHQMPPRSPEMMPPISPTLPNGPQPFSSCQTPMPQYPSMIVLIEATRPPPPTTNNNIPYAQPPQNYAPFHEMQHRAPFHRMPQPDNSNTSSVVAEPRHSQSKMKLFLDIPLPPGDPPPPPPPPFHPYEEGTTELVTPSDKTKNAMSFDSNGSVDSGVVEDITLEPSFFPDKHEDAKELSDSNKTIDVNEKDMEKTVKLEENKPFVNVEPVLEKEMNKNVEIERKEEEEKQSETIKEDNEEVKVVEETDTETRLIEHVTTCEEAASGSENVDNIVIVEKQETEVTDTSFPEDESNVPNDVMSEEQNDTNEESNFTDENDSHVLEEDKRTDGNHDVSAKSGGRRRRKTESEEPKEPIRNYRTRQHSATKPNSEDVYAFKEEPEELKKAIKRQKVEEPAKRERIVMTIKTTNGSSQLMASIVDSEVKETTKRRSTRQTKNNNKQVSRTSVDDTIDEVVRNSAPEKRVTRRNTRSWMTLTEETAISLPQVTRRTKGTTRKRRKKSEEQVQQAQLHMDEVIEGVSCQRHSEDDDDEREYSLPPSPSFPSPSPPSIMPSSPVSARTSIEPTTLIDPVSGLLIPMKESDNGHYIPLQSTAGTIVEEAEEQPPEKKLKLSEDCEERIETVISISPVTTTSVSPAMTTNCSTTNAPSDHDNEDKSNVSVDRTMSCIRTTCTINTTEAAMKDYPTATTIQPPPINKPMKPINQIITPIRYMKPKTHLIQSSTKEDKARECTINPPVLLSPRFEPLPCMMPANAGQWPMSPVMVTRPMNPNDSRSVYSATSPLLSPYASQSMLVTRNPHFPQPRDESVYQPLISPVYDARVRRRVCDIADEETESRPHILQPGLPPAPFESTAHVAGSFNWSPSAASPPPAHLNKAETCYGVIPHSQYIHPHFMYGNIPPSYMPMTTQGSIQGMHERDRVTSRLSSPPLELTRKSPQDSDLYRHGGPPPAHQSLHSPRSGQIQMAIAPPSTMQDTQEEHDPFRKYPVMWQGQLALKVKQSSIQMHFIFGNAEVARTSLNTTSLLRIAQRMRLEAQQLDTVIRKIQYEAEHCMLLGLTCGLDQSDVMTQTCTLSNNITYMQQKQAAGIVNLALPGSEQVDFVVHIFPPCEFARESLLRIAPDLFHRIQDMSYVLVIITEANRSFNNAEHAPVAAIN